MGKSNFLSFINSKINRTTHSLLYFFKSIFITTRNDIDWIFNLLKFAIILILFVFMFFIVYGIYLIVMLTYYLQLYIKNKTHIYERV